MHPGIRLVTAVVLLGLVFVSGVHYDTAEADHWPYPTPEELETAPDQHSDQRVFLFGTVERLDETAGTARIRVESDEGPFVVDVTGFETERDVRPGGTVQIVGEFQPGYSDCCQSCRIHRTTAYGRTGTQLQQSLYVVSAERVRVANSAGSSLLYKYVVSVIAALLVLILFFRYWRADVGMLSFEAR